LTIRPGAVALCSSEDLNAHVKGTVTDVAFRGRAYELAVDLQGGGRLNGIHSERRVDRGSHVGLQLAATGCVVFGGSGNDKTEELVALPSVETPDVIEGVPA
jgi:hypothetical protein